jgi:hypothetical protein
MNRLQELVRRSWCVSPLGNHSVRGPRACGPQLRHDLTRHNVEVKVQEDLPSRQRAGGAGQSAGGAEIVSRRARHRLAKTDPGNAGWQRDLSVSYGKLADVFKRSGETGDEIGCERRQPISSLTPRPAGLRVASISGVAILDHLVVGQASARQARSTSSR